MASKSPSGAAVRTLATTFILSCFAAAALAQARTYATGDLTMPCQSPCSTSTGPLSATCAASAVADLPTRWAQAQFPSSWAATSTSRLKWGPDLNTYAAVTASQVTSCNPAAWAGHRMNRAINDTIALGINYCHHHAPAYVTPTSVRVPCDPTEPGVDSSSCVCNSAGLTKPKPWQGVDCSNFVAFILDLAFGFYPTSSIAELACHPTYAPGRLLNTVTVSKQNELLPGDLVFITLGKTGRTAPVRVSHVVMWTGLTANMDASATGPLSKAALLATLPSTQQPAVEACMNDRKAKGLPTYVIADSHHDGPALRPFCGWYISSYSHARRVINPSAALPTNQASVAYWDDVAGNCQSMWALQA